MNSRGALRLSKHHGAGNDFLVLLDPDDRRPLSAAEARLLCDRHRGIGADGVLRAMTGSGAAALAMDLRNADGGVAEMSGNGIRCLVQAAVDAGMVRAGVVAVQTLGGLRSVEYEPGPETGLGYGRVGMGHAVLGPDLGQDVPPGARWGQRVDMGNPHVVLFGAVVEDDVVRSEGNRLERSVAGGANVEFAWPGPGAGELTLRVWERGVGETLACGTGACAVAAAAHAHHDAGARVRVHNPGGPLDVELGDAGIVLAGPTQKVGDVTVDEAVLEAMVKGAHAVSDALSTEVATRQ
ncbi:MAG TPA: diaminopimelate epimerase [Acidimicrobiales bacterium]|nr:diaminopimelate epimerase [Acidimicrobiales bacterium]